MKKSGKGTCWMPVQRNGVLWIEWAQANRKNLIKSLNSQFAGWRETLRVVRCDISWSDK